MDISSLLVDYDEKGLSLRQIAAQKVHSRSTVSKLIKGAGRSLCVAGHGHGNPSQLKYGYRKNGSKVVPHLGEQQIIGAVKDLRAEGMTLRQIAHRMTVLKIPSKNGKQRWHPMMIKRILKS
jgi:hypothetical protein